MHVAYWVFFPYEVFNLLLIFSLPTILARVVSEAGCNISFSPVSLEP